MNFDQKDKVHHNNLGGLFFEILKCIMHDKYQYKINILQFLNGFSLLENSISISYLRVNYNGKSCFMVWSLWVKMQIRGPTYCILHNKNHIDNDLWFVCGFVEVLILVPIFKCCIQKQCVRYQFQKIQPCLNPPQIIVMIVRHPKLL